MSILSRLGINASQLDFTVKQFLRNMLANTTIAAAGSAQTDATPITTSRVMVTAADGAKGVILPVAEIDMVVEVINTVSNQDLLVYPNSGAVINALSADAAFTVVAGASRTFYCDAKLHWYVGAGNLSGTATTSSTAELNILDGATVTAAELNMAADNSANTEVVAATNVILAAESGSTYFLNHATEFVSTLPAPFLGARFTFIVANAPETASYTIVTDAAAEIIVGHVLPADGAAGDVEATAGGTTITFVDGAAVIGDRVDVISDGTLWYARASCAVATGITITG